MKKKKKKKKKKTEFVTSVVVKGKTMAATKSLLLHPHYPEVASCCLKVRSSSQRQSHLKNSESDNLCKRRGIVMVSIASLALSFAGKPANGLDMRMVAPEQTVEEAESGIKEHALTLLEVKALIDSESWSEAQKFLRRSSSYLKQDFYTIIQNRPPRERPQLRKLYLDLFSNVTKLDYAAQNKDASRVLQCYDNIKMALNDILTRI